MKKIFMFSIVFVLGLFLSGLAMAQTTGSDIVPSDTLMPGMIESTGTHFEINNSDYLNIVLDSSESITLRLESIPEMITMHVEPASEAASTQITISGFQPSTTYYKYEDNYHNLNEFTTDGNGSYSWTQDLSQSHLVFIQPRKSTKFIKDNATGGDCNQVGNWVWTTKTCTLTTDVYETIQIDSDYITLDGNGHTLTGTQTGFGIYPLWVTGTTIKNLNVKNFSSGIYIYGASNNTFIDSIIQENSSYDLHFDFDSYYSDCNNVIQNITGSGGRPIKYFNFSVNLENEVLSQLILCNADYSNINNVTIKGSETLKNNGLLLIRTDYSSITNTNSSDNYSGISLVRSSNNILIDNSASSNYRGGISLAHYSSNNTLTNNTVSNNTSYGISSLYDSNNNNLTDNTVTSNTGNGILLLYSSNNLLISNTLSNNYGGLVFGSSNNNKIYNNNFIDNLGWPICRQACIFGISRGNVFNLPAPTGGNYWNNFDTPTEGCYDINNDGFCDTSYYFYGGVDYLPWAKQSGWEVPADTTSPTTSATLSGTSGNNGWYVSNVQLTLTSVDNTDGSGVKEIHYSIDGGAETVVSGSSASVTINTDGTHTLTYYAVDNATNTEIAYVLIIKIDKTFPIITILGVNDGAAYALGLVPKANYTATDATSGIATISDSLTGGDSFGMGTFTYSVIATDNAGNTVTQTVTYTVIATIDGLTELINQFLISGAVDNTGIANSLLSKINNALTAESSGNGQTSDNIMQAFINQVSAQAGQHISQDAAAILINAATYIINN